MPCNKKQLDVIIAVRVHVLVLAQADVLEVVQEVVLVVPEHVWVHVVVAVQVLAQAVVLWGVFEDLMEIK